MNTSVFPTLIERYKRKLADTGIGDETYKWVWIQENLGRPDLNADDFVREIKLSTRTNLLYHNSSAVLIHMAEERPDELKSVLRDLFDESVDLQERLDAYMTISEEIYAQIRKNQTLSLQDERTAALLLAMRYPDTYPLYKEKLYKNLCSELGIELQKPRKKYVDYIRLVDEFVESHIRHDRELIELVQSQLPDNAYPDPSFLLLAQDILYQNYEGEASNRVSPVDPNEPRIWLLSPGPSASEWPMFRSGGFAGLNQDFRFDLTLFTSHAVLKKQITSTSKGEKKNRTLALWEFAHVMKPGDFIIVKKGLKTYIGVGKVLSSYRFDSNREEYPHVRDVDWFKEGEWEESSQQIVAKTLTDVTKYPDYGRKLKALIGFGDSATDDFSRESTPIKLPYTLTHATSNSFLDPDWLTDTLELWRTKLNLVLQGPPGTGKTFVAKRLAWLLMGEKDESRLHMVQFHPSYSYEDFIEGYRPNGQSGFILKSGHFLSFCRRAASDPNRPYVFIIDEINRGNLSKVFGEVMMGIEADKRGEAIHLQYSLSDSPFSIPKNVHLIGTMNTADRSLALVDYALRRRFAFQTVSPEFGKQFVAFLESKSVPTSIIDQITHGLKSLNEMIEKDSSLGPGYLVGHSYFCEPPAIAHHVWLDRIWKYEVLPLMEEYWFDQTDEVKKVKQLLAIP